MIFKRKKPKQVHFVFRVEPFDAIAEADLSPEAVAMLARARDFPTLPDEPVEGVQALLTHLIGNLDGLTALQTLNRLMELKLIVLGGSGKVPELIGTTLRFLATGKTASQVA